VTESVTEEPTTEAPGAGQPDRTSAVEGVVTSPADDTATLPPRGRDPSLPPDADPEPLPIGLGDMWRIARKTYRAERRYYLKLDRHRPLSLRRLSGSIWPRLHRPVFIVGAARSGTTFLGDCIGRIPEMTYHHEPPATKAAGRHVYDGVWSFRRSRWFFRTVYRWMARVELDGDLRFAEKTPTNIFLIPFLSMAFPDSQFIHIIRDGRDAASSHMHKPWLRAEDAWSGEREPGGYLHGPWPKFWVEPERRDEFIRTSDARRMAWAWRRYTETGLTEGPKLGPERYHELRYEELVRQPEEEAVRILDFLGIDAPGSRETFMNATLRADDSSVGAWRDTFYPSELAEIDAEAGDLLRQLGYDD
jgi:Sulfotransferase family